MGTSSVRYEKETLVKCQRSRVIKYTKKQIVNRYNIGHSRYRCRQKEGTIEVVDRIMDLSNLEFLFFIFVYFRHQRSHLLTYFSLRQIFSPPVDLEPPPHTPIRLPRRSRRVLLLYHILFQTSTLTRPHTSSCPTGRTCHPNKPHDFLQDTILV